MSKKSRKQRHGSKPVASVPPTTAQPAANGAGAVTTTTATTTKQATAKTAAPANTAKPVKQPYVPAAKRAPKAPPKKEHGPWMTGALIVVALHGLFTAALFFVSRKSGYTPMPYWLMGAAILLGLADVGSAVALWFWKRWGLYLYAAAALASIALGLVVYPSMLVAFHALIPVAILAYILTWQKKMPLLT